MMRNRIINDRGECLKKNQSKIKKLYLNYLFNNAIRSRIFQYSIVAIPIIIIIPVSYHFIIYCLNWLLLIFTILSIWFAFKYSSYFMSIIVTKMHTMQLTLYQLIVMQVATPSTRLMHGHLKKKRRRKE